MALSDIVHLQVSSWLIWSSHIGIIKATLLFQGERPPGQVQVPGWCCRASSTTPCPSPPSPPPPSPGWGSWHERGICFHSLSVPDAAQHSALRSSSTTRSKYILKGSILQTFPKNVYTRDTEQDSTCTSTREGFILRSSIETWEFLSTEIKQCETRMHSSLLLFLLPSLSLQCGISTHTEVGFRWIVYIQIHIYRYI